MPSAIRAVEGGVIVAVAVVPRARTAGIVGYHGERLKVRVHAPPEKGRANAEVVAILIAATDALSGRVVSGASHRLKSVFLQGTDVRTVETAVGNR